MLSKPAQTNWAEGDIKSALLRAVVFLLVFFTAHWLLLWLHPFGEHRFFWNLALGALTSWLLVSSESTWSPFQSDEVREICAHLSPTEHALLMEDARERGRKIGYWFAFPLAFVAVLLFSSWRIGLALGALFVVYFVVGVLPRFRAMRRRSIELLCGTEWARTRNYTPTNIKLMTFPWS